MATTVTSARIARLRRNHRADHESAVHDRFSGNALRAAVLGANDGLVSNLSLVMGVAGAQLASASILVTGIAGLLAGALSMAMGEWISVQSARELYAHQIDVERLEIGIDPQELGGSAAVAAISSFVPFTLGAAVPVLPFAFLSGAAATATSVAASAAGLFLLGSAITLLTHRGIVRAGSRQLAIGLAAAALTFAIGRLVGVGIG